MGYRKTDLLKDLRRAAKNTALPWEQKEAVKWAVECIKRGDAVAELERLYRLNDTRP